MILGCSLQSEFQIVGEVTLKLDLWDEAVSKLAADERSKRGRT